MKRPAVRSPARGAPAPADVGTWWRLVERRLAGARLVFGHGTDNAHDEAAWLVCSVLGIPFDALAASLREPVAPARARKLERVCEERIATRAPLAYILREAWLHDHRFYVDRRVIVPRSHIAELLPRGLEPWLPRRRVRRVLDLCTGSGCLAILAALAYPRATVDASDLSAAALQVARRNVAGYRLQERVRLVRSDVFEALGDGRYDLIISNPPYVPEREHPRMPPEYRSEPSEALYGGPDGLDIVRRILRDAPRHLSEQGILVVEVGDGRKRVERAFPRAPFTWLATGAGTGLVFLANGASLPAAQKQTAAGSPRPSRTPDRK